ncbi:MAG: cytochrome c-type biogenesis protein CcmH [Anaerolineales bacterium]
MKIKWVAKSILLATLLTCISFNKTPNVSAQDIHPTDDEVNAISKQLYCPVCESIPLDACGTQACVQWRDTIRAKLTDGWSEEEIKQYFSDQYGIRVLAEPPAEGFNKLLWYLPPFLLLIGALLVTRLLSNTENRLHIQHETISNIDNANQYVERIEHDLKKWQ